MCQLTGIVQFVTLSVKEMLEGLTRLIRRFIGDSNVKTVDITGAPVLLDALLNEVVLVHLLALRPLQSVEIRALPHVADMCLSVLLLLVFADAEDQHGLRVLEVFKVEDSHRRVPVRIVEQFWLHDFLLHNLVLILFHLLCHGVANSASVLGKLYRKRRKVIG